MSPAGMPSSHFTRSKSLGNNTKANTGTDATAGSGDKRSSQSRGRTAAPLLSEPTDSESTRRGRDRNPPPPAIVLSPLPPDINPHDSVLPAVERAPARSRTISSSRRGKKKANTVGSARKSMSASNQSRLAVPAPGGSNKPDSTASSGSTASNISTATDIDDMRQEELFEFIRTVRDAVRVLRDACELYPQYLDLVDVANKVVTINNKAEQKVKDLEKAQETYPNVEVISFSRVDKDVLEDRLGVKSENIVHLEVKSFSEIIDTCEIEFPTISISKSLLYNPETWDHKSLYTELNTLFLATLNLKESSARQWIDEWLKKTIRQGLETDPTCSVLLLTEFVIATKCNLTEDNKRLSDVLVTWNGKSTFLTGVTDYLYIVLRPRDTDTQRQITPLKDLAEPKDINAHPLPLKLFDDLSVLEDAIPTIIEAKSLTAGELASFLPQVVAQALAATMLAARLQNVTFVLTNSQEWIFGLVHRAEDQPPTVFVSQSYFIFIEDIPSSANEAQDKAFSLRHPRYKQLIRTLLAWVKIDSNTLFRILTSQNNGNTPSMVYKV